MQESSLRPIFFNSDTMLLLLWHFRRQTPSDVQAAIAQLGYGIAMWKIDRGSRQALWPTPRRAAPKYAPENLVCWAELPFWLTFVSQSLLREFSLEHLTAGVSKSAKNLALRLWQAVENDARQVHRTI